ncbi:MAG: Dipeptidyl carboxypeptidase Dcp [Candidatus Saccharicenans subterraneus]|uniref:Dipeptidyl carboxypeptidase Dcp n=1 Tax=Candidatus Saccharicenans subterraneus TaxID=2508984 RepID=A0A3E2BJ71_9BACT|nr:MAG: Dipeptidyl carboxypeptidase Dcp [Candidatus Saccharicenans subterraneum]
MKFARIILIALIASAVLVSCGGQKKEKKEVSENPFFTDWTTPFGAPPFDRIKVEHFKPAVLEGIKRHQEEIKAIAENPEPPTFANTLEALDRSGLFLDRAEKVMENLLSAHTSDELQAVAQELAPALSAHYDSIFLDAKLFARVKAVYDQRDQLNMNPEQKQLLEKFYKDFVRAGAGLDEAKKARLKEINQELAVLELKFAENVLKETNAFELVIENAADLEGLPANVVAAAAEAAKERGKEGKWVFTLHKPSLIPFLQYSPRRELREKIFKAYINRGNNGNERDNKALVARTIALRIEKAGLLGYKTWADYVLEENMAKTPENVYRFLDQVWKPALTRAREEAAELQKLIRAEGGNFKLEPWDWWYYAEKLRKQKYALDEEMLRPYFKLENVIDGVFLLANKLYGLKFEERKDIPVYHPEVRVFEVKEADGRLVGILYTDYFPRASKGAGAWMNALRDEYKVGGERIAPLIINCGNFTKSTPEQPSLLSWEEVTTLFHEFGHALHGLLTDCTYLRLTGTNVARDFVELPSQIMENWVAEPEFLRLFARHYQTGEPIPDELVAKIKNAQYFNQGFITVEYMSACYLDMDWHVLTAPVKAEEVMDFENRSLARIGLIPEIVVRYRSPYFSHIFAGGYSAGYYSYIWAEVLDADAFEAFKEKGLFDAETARAFRENILARGGSEDPMTLYVKFRGREPKVEPMLRRRGL